MGLKQAAQTEDSELRKTLVRHALKSESRERNFRKAIATNADGIVLMNQQGVIIFANPSVENIFGLKAADLRGVMLGIPSAAGETTELDVLRSDGANITVEMRVVETEWEGEVAYLAALRDITERKRVEAAIRENEEKYRDLFENANDLIYTHDLAGNFTSINRAGEIITGYSREEAVSINISQVVAPEYLEQAQQMTAKKLNGGGPTAYEVEIIAKDGRLVPLELSTRLIYQDGRPIGVQGIGRDITERKKAEEALRASELRYRQLGEGILHQIWTALPDGTLDYVNKRTLDYFAIEFETMIGRGWRDVIHPDDYQETQRRWRESLRTGEPFEMEFRLLRSDGQYRWHVSKATAGLDQDGKIVKWFGTNTDIHEQKESEEKLNYYARHDPLTDLPNRMEFMQHLRQAI
ncbi:MAG: hypothetical protein C4325_12500, partial [Blastocatellia bacterium]